MQLRISSLGLLILLCLTLAVPAVASDIGLLYSNGPVNGYVAGWQISGLGNEVTNSFVIGAPNCASASGCTVTGFQFSVWVFPGDTPVTVDWSITSTPFGTGGTTYGSGTSPLTSVFLFNNGLYDIDQETVSGLAVQLTLGTYWLNLQDAIVPSGNPVYWDQNMGAGCTGDGTPGSCPSTAYASYQVGAIPSEDPDIFGYANSGTTPEPGSIVLLGSGVLAVTAVFRRRLNF